MSGDLEDLLAEARRAGQVDSTGRFTLDFRAALAKLRGFQVENQYHYVNRLVRAATLAGSDRVQIQALASKTRVYFPVQVCQPSQLPRLFEEIFQNARPAARELATATNIALALEPERIEVQTCDGQSGEMLVVEGRRTGGVYETEANLFATGPGPTGTTFQMCRTMGASVRNWGTQSAEYLEILRRFRYSPLSIEINKEKVDKTSWWGAPLQTGLFTAEQVKLRPGFFSLGKNFPKRHHVAELRVYHREDVMNGIGLGPPCSSSYARLGNPGPPAAGGRERCHMALGICADSKRPCVANFVYHGETLQSFPAKLPLPGTEILICGNNVPLDMSGEKFVDGEFLDYYWQQAKWVALILSGALGQAYHGNPVARCAFDKELRWTRYLEWPPKLLGLLKLSSPDDAGAASPEPAPTSPPAPPDPH